VKLSKDVERLEAENRKLQDELEELRNHPKSDSYYDTSVRPVDLIAFPVTSYHAMADLDGRELGRLVAAFNEHFAFYNLVVQNFQAKDDHGRYKLLAIKRYSEAFRPDPVRDRQFPREDEVAMRHFLHGFVAGLRSFGRKKKGWR
jgi:hypothetical protein